MQQYHQLLKEIKEKGTLKSAAREGMPGTISLFGYQMRFDLSKGFPLVTTKKVSFKNIVVELLWFLKGGTNVKFLIDNGCNVWNEDAYNYYKKMIKVFYNRDEEPPFSLLVDDPNQDRTREFTFEEFVENIKADRIAKYDTYKLGDCGKQYGWLWRNWERYEFKNGEVDIHDGIKLPISGIDKKVVDQLKELIEGLKENPMGRRHIITAWNPATLDDMALNACHAFVQFNCRPLSDAERVKLYDESKEQWLVRRSLGHFIYPEHYQPQYEDDIPDPIGWELDDEEKNYLDEQLIPQHYLDCQLYQRSADVVLGVPYNIASYALLTEILCKICNMVPGEFVHTFGDVHIYENHLQAVEEQLQRETKKLPRLQFDDELLKVINENWYGNNIDRLIDELKISDFQLENYNPHPKLQNETKLFTGLK